MSQDEARDRFQDALLEDDPVQLYEQAPCGYLSTTPDGRIVKVNATFATWSGFTADELVGRAFSDLLSPGGRIYHETHYSPLLHMQGSVREIALELVRPNGDRLPVLLNARLDRDGDGDPRVIRVAVFDATERRGYERELLRAKEHAEIQERRASSLARTLQETLIPPTPPTIAGLEVAAAYRPAGDGTEVGGDFYDVFPLSLDDWIVVLGDVAGKGAGAAVVTALARYTLRTVAVGVERPSEMLSRLDEAVQRHETDRFLTLVLARLRRAGEGWSVVISAGGHPPPVLVRNAEFPQEVAVHGPLVGLLADPHFTDHELRLLPGDTLVLYTDGVTEARSDEGQFGVRRMLESIDRSVRSGGANPADALVAGLVGDVLAFQGGDARDDIAVLAVSAPG